MPGSTVYNRRGQTVRFRLSDYEKAQERRAERQRENDAAARRAKGWPETGRQAMSRHADWCHIHGCREPNHCTCDDPASPNSDNEGAS